MTTDSTPIKVTSPSDILGYIPHCLGFQPRQSLVFIALSGTRVGATLRLDLPQASEPLDLLGYASQVRSFLEADRTADATLLAMYTQEPWLERDSPPHADLVCLLGLELADAGMPLREAWHVSETHWRDYFCTDSGCCPWPGRPVETIRSSLLSTEMVYQGSSFAPSSEAAVAQGDPPCWPLAAQVLEAAGEVADQLGNSWLEAVQFAQTLAVWDRCIDLARDGAADAGLRRDPKTAGFLIASLACRSVRDALLVSGAAGLSVAVAGAAGCGLLSEPASDLRLPDGCEPVDLMEMLVDADLKESAECFGAVLVGRSTERPDWGRLDAAHALFRELAAVAEGDAKAALLTMLAWIEWARARGSLAQQYLDRCLAECPDYNLARLLRELLAAGALPSWSTVRESAWKGSYRMAGGGDAAGETAA
jgi:hypothetical protein